MEKRHRAKGMVLLCPPRRSTLPSLPCSPARKPSELCPYGVLWRLYCIGTIAWLLVIEVNLFPWVCRQNWKFQPSNHKVGTPSNQPSSSGASKSYLINKRHLFVSHHLGNFSGFRSSVPEMGMKNKCIYFYYRLQHHSIYLLLLFS